MIFGRGGTVAGLVIELIALNLLYVYIYIYIYIYIRSGARVRLAGAPGRPGGGAHRDF